MRVYVLTFCPGTDVLYGNLPALRTLRTGFPTAEIVVIDNRSCAKATDLFKALCVQNGYTFRQLKERVHHDEYLQWVTSAEQGPVAIVDPDVIFWENCEQLLAATPSDTLLKGRLIPAMRSATPEQTHIAPRLHPSFLCIPDCGLLHKEISITLGTGVNVHGGDSVTPWRHGVMRGPGAWVAYDTGAIIYEALRIRCLPFTELELNRYDHLFFGSHISKLSVCGYGSEVVQQAHRVHAVAKTGRYSVLKGVWRQQQQYFERRACTIPQRTAP